MLPHLLAYNFSGNFKEQALISFILCIAVNVRSSTKPWWAWIPLRTRWFYKSSLPLALPKPQLLHGSISCVPLFFWSCRWWAFFLSNSFIILDRAYCDAAASWNPRVNKKVYSPLLARCALKRLLRQTLMGQACLAVLMHLLKQECHARRKEFCCSGWGENVGADKWWDGICVEAAEGGRTQEDN